MIALGVALACASPWVVLAVAAYFLAFYPSVMREEAAFLAARFPEEHAAWSAAVPMFWPRPTPGGPRASRFEWARVAANRNGARRRPCRCSPRSFSPCRTCAGPWASERRLVK